jgi:hypothetical protein
MYWFVSVGGVPVVASINGHIGTDVGWTIPEWTKALNEDPEVILLLL